MFDPRTRILIADDMKLLRRMVGNSLKTLGYSDFVEAEDGAAAWDMLTNARPPVGLIISDWNMPNSTGLDFLKRVRSDTRFKQLPFILVTAESEKQQVAEAMAAGVSNYLLKPFDAESLKVKIQATWDKIHQSAAA